MEKRDDMRKDTLQNGSVADRLPELDEEQIRRTRETTPRAWAYNYLSAGIGYAWTHDDLGVSLQITSDDTMRLLAVVDHPYCLLMAASMVATLEDLDLRMDLSQAILVPYVEGGNADAQKATDKPPGGDGFGVEVV